MSSQLNSKRHFLDNLVSLYMLWCDLQKFKPILQSNVIINILASKFVAWIQKHALSSSSFQVSGPARQFGQDIQIFQIFRA